MPTYPLILTSFLAGLFILPGTAFAIELNPSRNQIDRALEEGLRAAKDRLPPDRLYAWFGSTGDLEPKGFIMTRIVGLRVMASHFALRGVHPTEEEIQRIVADEMAIISVTIYGETPTFAKDSYMVFKQGEKLVKPANIRFDSAGRRSMVWPNNPRYQAKVVGFFRYERFDPMAPTTILVFPSQGGEISFEVEFSSIP